MNDFQKYNPDQHHRRSIRLQDYDYSQEGLYFITICCYDKECLFGEIVNGKMVLNEAGKMANKCWMEIPEHFPNVVLHKHIVMPNHVHGIIELTHETRLIVGAENFLPKVDGENVNQFQKMIRHSIASIVKGFKIGVTKWYRYSTRAENFLPLQPNRQIWQRNYWEHVIRNEKSYYKIAEYIINNPAKWDEDSLNPEYNGMK